VSFFAVQENIAYRRMLREIEEHDKEVDTTPCPTSSHLCHSAACALESYVSSTCLLWPQMSTLEARAGKFPDSRQLLLNVQVRTQSLLA
jgi:hypothetical protein